MRKLTTLKSISSTRNASQYAFKARRPFCSSAHNHNKHSITNTTSSTNKSSLSSYDEQYKALSNLDFMKAAKILFSEPPNKKKFGLDFHLVQLFFVCLPSLAVYLVAQYARSEMRKMDVELERKKQAEFEAQAKEMELKAAEEKAAAASNPQLLEVKERLEKLEETVKEIVEESKKQSADATITGQEGSNEQKQAVQVEPGKTSGLASATHPLDDNKNDNRK